MSDTAAPATSRTVLPGTAMIAVTFGLARYGYGLLLPDMRAELALGPGAAGLISSAAYGSYLVANVGVVWVAGRWGPRVAIGLAAALAAAGMAVIASAAGVPALAVGVVVSGAAAGLAFPPYADLTARHVPERRRDLAWSTISSGTGWGVALAGPIAIAAGAVIVLGGFMAGLDTSLVNVGLTTIGDDLHSSLTGVQWSTSGYLLALAAALPACPWLQRRLGASRLWLIALVAFVAASLLCAVAPTLPVLLAARVLQGVAGGLLVPTGQSIAARAVGPERLSRMMATAGIPIMLAPAIGPALGGLLIDTLSWRWLFLVNLPVGAVAALLAWRIMPRDAPDPAATLDVRGLVLLSTALPALSLGLTHLGEPGPLGIVSTGLGAVLLVAFAAGAARRRAPLLDVGLFRRLPYATAQVTVFFTGLSLFGGLILLPLYDETLRGLTVVHTGLLLLAYGFGAVAALPAGARLTTRSGSGTACVTGLTVVIVATVPFVFLPRDTSLVAVELLQALRGFGVGLAGIPAMTATMRAAQDRPADATTTGTILQRLGGSIGTAVVVLVLARTTPQLAAFQAAHAVLVAAATLALVPAVALAVSDRRGRRVSRPDQKSAISA